MNYDNTNSGALFANADRKTDKHPHARGTANIDGVEYYVSAWTKVSKKGDKYQSLSFKRKDEQPEGRSQDAGGAMDDGIPFMPAEYRSLA